MLLMQTPKSLPLLCGTPNGAEPDSTISVWLELRWSSVPPSHVTRLKGVLEEHEFREVCFVCEPDGHLGIRAIVAAANTDELCEWQFLMAGLLECFFAQMQVGDERPTLH